MNNQYKFGKKFEREHEKRKEHYKKEFQDIIALVCEFHKIQKNLKATQKQNDNNTKAILRYKEILRTKSKFDNALKEKYPNIYWEIVELIK